MNKIIIKLKQKYKMKPGKQISQAIKHIRSTITIITTTTITFISRARRRRTMKQQQHRGKKA
ncbi:hypothetical protein E2C01_051582 [Portunus trituberculatus]|uniref:Uncharacterized protein n=1 Tax=Portunus trituberculatus TaxID=210409 RepID=A0A5B7GKQ1_PORTR|nr:hypothetical protein [Portunus trituberculatus]